MRRAMVGIEFYGSPLGGMPLVGVGVAVLPGGEGLIRQFVSLTQFECERTDKASAINVRKCIGFVGNGGPAGASRCFYVFYFNLYVAGALSTFVHLLAKKAGKIGSRNRSFRHGLAPLIEELTSATLADRSSPSIVKPAKGLMSHARCFRGCAPNTAESHVLCGRRKRRLDDSERHAGGLCRRAGRNVSRGACLLPMLDNDYQEINFASRDNTAV